jgi:hypothetical protein
MVLTYITLLLFIWTILLSGLNADQMKGLVYSADFLNNFNNYGHSNSEPCSGAVSFWDYAMKALLEQIAVESQVAGGERHAEEQKAIEVL